ncbi:hypothetical protein pipiens_001291 [Culex pipiens pipiens]|uniref:Uncharacterized protein n=1 Tax=Culex pipiens pipiens TaxID=38569 RepID=A0ABD1D6G0_CULPP
MHDYSFPVGLGSNEAIKHNSKLVAEGIKAVPCVCCRRAFARNSRLNGLPPETHRKRCRRDCRFNQFGTWFRLFVLKLKRLEASQTVELTRLC